VLSVYIVQINFSDHTQLLVWGGKVTYRNKQQVVRTYSLARMFDEPRPDLMKRMKYTRDILQQLMNTAVVPRGADHTSPATAQRSIAPALKPSSSSSSSSSAAAAAVQSGVPSAVSSRNAAVQPMLIDENTSNGSSKPAATAHPSSAMPLRSRSANQDLANRGVVAPPAVRLASLKGVHGNHAVSASVARPARANVGSSSAMDVDMQYAPAVTSSSSNAVRSMAR